MVAHIAAAVLWCWLPNVDNAAVCPDDGPQFGASYGVARANRDLAYRHRWFMRDRMSWLPPAGFDAWDGDMAARWAAWDWLGDALDPKRDTRARLYALAHVRRILGPDAYDARMMPAPIPSYIR